jgi:FtsP/CotA-like multicopper oxidase with cupredoxin domain
MDRQRRKILELGLGGIGLIGGAIACSPIATNRNNESDKSVGSPTKKVMIPPINLSAAAQERIKTSGLDPIAALREFDYGKITQENGRTVREFQLTAKSKTVKLNASTDFITWNVNDRVPGPTLRATEGDRIRIAFANQGGHAHSLHFHGEHPSEMDGVKPIRNGAATIYEFDAMPYGVHLYHCHVAPVARHIGKGLYGMFIIDPPTPRPPADELVLIMAGYDIDGDGRNEMYAFNGLPHFYMQQPIAVQQNQLLRLYILNVIEFDPVATFHVHANMFQVYRTGRGMTPSEETDVITMGTAERHILELTYRFTGKYMFHPHQDTIAEAGCMGLFDVVAS